MPPATGRGLLGFIPPRYGDDVVGGSESLMRELAHGLAGRGWEVEVLTSWSRDHFTWAQAYEAGVSEVDGVRVRRFPVVVPRSRSERVLFNRSIVAGAPLRLDEQYRWVNADMRSPELFHHLVDHAGEYRALVFSPYLFWPTFAGAQVAPERTILLPCLHDEPEAYLELFRPLFSDVAGVWFLSDPEAELARRLHPDLARHEIVGTGVHVPEGADGARFRAKYGIDGPFVLYAGRREAGKNWDELLDWFAAAVERADLDLTLVTIGAVPIRVPGAIADRVVDLGFLPTADRDDAFAAADAYVQPSRYESFSRTMMEAWLAGTLVIANGASAVNRWHCERSGAGLVYDDDLELEQCLRFVTERGDAARALAAPGRRYVLDHYTWDPVLDRLEQLIDEWLPAGGPS